MNLLYLIRDDYGISFLYLFQPKKAILFLPGYRLATVKEQARNRRTTYWIEFDGIKKSLAEWCEELKLPYKQTWKQLRVYGWSPEKAFLQS